MVIGDSYSRSRHSPWRGRRRAQRRPAKDLLVGDSYTVSGSAEGSGDDHLHGLAADDVAYGDNYAVGRRARPPGAAMTPWAASPATTICSAARASIGATADAGTTPRRTARYWRHPVRSRRAAIALSVSRPRRLAGARVRVRRRRRGPGRGWSTRICTAFGKARAIVRLKRFLHDVRKRKHVRSLHGYRELSAMRSRRGSAAQKAVLARDRKRKRRLDEYLAHKRHRLGHRRHVGRGPR